MSGLLATEAVATDATAAANWRNRGPVGDAIDASGCDRSRSGSGWSIGCRHLMARGVTLSTKTHWLVAVVAGALEAKAGDHRNGARRRGGGMFAAGRIGIQVR